MPSETVSLKLRSADHAVVGRLAEMFGSNRLEILTASRLAFEAMPESKQRSFVERARRLFPMPYPRIGRGNRTRVPT